MKVWTILLLSLLSSIAHAIPDKTAIAFPGYSSRAQITFIYSCGEIYGVTANADGYHISGTLKSIDADPEGLQIYQYIYDYIIEHGGISLHAFTDGFYGKRC